MRAKILNKEFSQSLYQEETTGIILKKRLELRAFCLRWISPKCFLQMKEEVCRGGGEGAGGGASIHLPFFCRVVHEISRHGSLHPFAAHPSSALGPPDHTFRVHDSVTMLIFIPNSG